MSDVENQEDVRLTSSSVAASNGVGSDAIKKAQPPPAQSSSMFLLIVAWYASSVVCTNTSKSLNLPWTTLTFFQMLISTLCAIAGILVFKLDGHGSLKLWPKREATKLTILLSLTFCAGFVTLNASLSFMHVSAVMTMRAAEPVATWLLGLALLPDEKSPMSAVLALIPVVVGAGLSAVAKGTNVNHMGLGLVMACNVCFALRTITTKLLKQQFTDVDNFNLFLQLCLMGSIWQGIVVILVGRNALADLLNIPMLLLNGLTFYLYLQLSWVVMSKVGAVTHSVCNSLRRPVICATGWAVFGGATVEGIAGVLIATGGTMLYARAKRRG
jgi:drug/metabolite transporter (DMT)-like permease